MPRLTRLYIKKALIYLAAGVSLGDLLLADRVCSTGNIAHETLKRVG